MNKRRVWRRRRSVGANTGARLDPYRWRPAAAGDAASGRRRTRRLATLGPTSRFPFSSRSPPRTETHWPQRGRVCWHGCDRSPPRLSPLFAPTRRRWLPLSLGRRSSRFCQRRRAFRRGGSDVRALVVVGPSRPLHWRVVKLLVYRRPLPRYSPNVRGIRLGAHFAHRRPQSALAFARSRSASQVAGCASDMHHLSLTLPPRSNIPYLRSRSSSSRGRMISSTSRHSSFPLSTFSGEKRKVFQPCTISPRHLLPYRPKLCPPTLGCAKQKSLTPPSI